MPVASLAIPVVPARTMRSPIAGIGTGLLAHREIIEVTGSGHQLSVLRCRWAVRIAATRAYFAHFSGECLKPETGWRMTESAANHSLHSLFIRENTGNFVDLARFCTDPS